MYDFANDQVYRHAAESGGPAECGILQDCLVTVLGTCLWTDATFEKRDDVWINLANGEIINVE